MNRSLAVDFILPHSGWQLNGPVGERVKNVPLSHQRGARCCRSWNVIVRLFLFRFLLICYWTIFNRTAIVWWALGKVMICVIRDALLDTCNESISNGKWMDWNTNIHAYIHILCVRMHVWMYVCMYVYICLYVFKAKSTRGKKRSMYVTLVFVLACDPACLDIFIIYLHKEDITPRTTSVWLPVQQWRYWFHRAHALLDLFSYLPSAEPIHNHCSHFALP